MFLNIYCLKMCIRDSLCSGSFMTASLTYNSSVSERIFPSLSVTIRVADSSASSYTTVPAALDYMRVRALPAQDSSTTIEAEDAIPEELEGSIQVAESDGADRKSTRLNSSHSRAARMPSSA